jgi:hypothetical protein
MARNLTAKRYIKPPHPEYRQAIPSVMQENQFSNKREGKEKKKKKERTPYIEDGKT